MAICFSAMMSTFFIEKRSGGERRIFRKAAVLTSEIFFDTVKIMLGFRDKKPRLIFQTGGLRVFAKEG